MDPTSISAQTPDEGRDGEISPDNKRLLRIGVPLDYNIDELDPLVRSTWMQTLRDLQKKGLLVKPIRLPHTRLALSAYYVLAPAEASSNLARYDGVRYGHPTNKSHRATGGLYSGLRAENLGDEARRRILLGSYSLSAAAIDNYFIKAQQIRRLVQQDFNSVFRRPHPLLADSTQIRSDTDDRVDAILSPTALSLPPLLEDVLNREPTTAYISDLFTVPASLAGLPAMSVPVSFDKPDEWDKHDVATVGMQVITQYGDEETAFAIGKVLES